jgi:hypothetical protein
MLTVFGLRTSNNGGRRIHRTSGVGLRTADLERRADQAVSERAVDTPGRRTAEIGPRRSGRGRRAADVGPRTSDRGRRTADVTSDDTGPDVIPSQSSLTRP